MGGTGGTDWTREAQQGEGEGAAWDLVMVALQSSAPPKQEVHRSKTTHTLYRMCNVFLCMCLSVNLNLCLCLCYH